MRSSVPLLGSSRLLKSHLLVKLIRFKSFSFRRGNRDFISRYVGVKHLLGQVFFGRHGDGGVSS